MGAKHFSLAPLAPQIPDSASFLQVSPITNLEMQNALDKCRMITVGRDQLANAVFRILQAHLSYQATNYSMKPRSILNAIKKLPTLNEKTKALLDSPFWCRGRLQLSHALLRRSPRKHKGSLLPQKRCCNGIGVLGSSIWGMPLTKDA